MRTNTWRTGVVAAAVGAAGLVAGLAFASTSAAQSGDMPITTNSVVAPMDQMMGDSHDMGSMMGSMMGSGDMTAMHQMMHTMMRGSVPEEVLAACNEAHANMTTGSVDTTGTGSVDHTAHHMGSGS